MSTSDDASSWRWWATIGVCLVLLVAPVAFILMFAADDSATEGSRTPRSDEVEDVGMAHVHGLGVNPASSELVAATHFGVFVVRDGTATRVGPAQDTMGFTITGPDTFLASGHPDFAVDDEPLLGLIRSNDGGRSWNSVSRRGISDFHALQAAHGQVYGYDATAEQFLVSTDGRNWQLRAALDLRDFAVDPTDPDRLIATDDSSTLISTSGGRTWQPLAAPRLQVVSWPEADMLYGIDADGRVHLSRDAGLRWSALGTVGGAPNAIAVAPDGAVYVAVEAVGIVRSDDGGRSFVPVYQLE